MNCARHSRLPDDHPGYLRLLGVLALLLTFGSPLAAQSSEPPDTPGETVDPVRVLLLDYHAPDEHDVLLSHLCVEPCKRSNDCPDELVRDGVDYWSEDFRVYRPGYLGGGAAFVVDIYRQRGIDLISFSGHHASGFTGETGRGRFHTEALAAQVGELPGAADFFTHPSMVMLQGCRTDVKSSFSGDPVEYVLHIIQETQVRDDQFGRLLAAVQQIGGVQEAYRDLFPNACLLGYAGTQAPGGRLEIFAQIHSLLRDLLPEDSAGGITDLGLGDARGDAEALEAINRRVDRQCPRGWPCNLCDHDPAYRPLARNLAQLIRSERQRIHQQRQERSLADAARLETRLEDASYYANTRWSCSTAPPGTAPVWPDPVDESPFGELFVRLLWMELEGFTPSQRRNLRLELLHRLAAIEFAPVDAERVRDLLHQPVEWQRLIDFQDNDLLDLSTFRQQDFYGFLGAVGCGDCLATAFTGEHPSLLRENAARALRPELGPDVYALALADTHARVRAVAAQRLAPELGAGLLEKALTDPDAKVREAAEAVRDRHLAETTEPEPPGIETPGMETPRIEDPSEFGG